MLKEILVKWLLENCDCETMPPEWTDGKPFILGMNRSNLDVGALAQFILDNPCTD